MWATWAWSRASRDGLVVVSDGVAGEGVGEGRGPGLGVLDEPCLARRGQGVVDVLHRLSGHRRQQVQREAPAEDGGEEEQLAGPLGQALQAAHDDVADGRGQRRAVAGVEPGELDEEVGVAARAPVPVVHHLGGYDGAGHGVHQAPGLLRRQAGQVEPGHVVARQLLADLGQVAGRLGQPPPGDDDRQAVPGCGARDEVSQHLEGSGVGPVQVVEHQQDRLRTTTGR